MPLDGTTWQADENLDETTKFLIEARALLERGWCTHHLAQSKRGDNVNPKSSLAVKWCSIGALIAVGMPHDFNQPVGYTSPTLDRLAAAMGATVHQFNDRQKSVEPVLVAFDRAIARGDNI